MAETETKQGQGLRTNRIELIHMITNLIQGSDFTLIHTEIEASTFDDKDRDDAAMLAIHIVDGLEDEAEKRTPGEMLAIPWPWVPIVLTCPECGSSTAGSIYSGVRDEVVIQCAACRHEAALSEFRTAAAGEGEGE